MRTAWPIWGLLLQPGSYNKKHIQQSQAEQSGATANHRCMRNKDLLIWGLFVIAAKANTQIIQQQERRVHTISSDRREKEGNTM